MGNCYNALWHCGPELHPSLAAPYVTPGGTSQRRWQHAECRWQAGGWFRSHRAHPPPAEVIYRCTLARTASHFKPQRAQSELVIRALTFNLKGIHPITSQLMKRLYLTVPIFSGRGLFCLTSTSRCRKSLIAVLLTRGFDKYLHLSWFQRHSSLVHAHIWHHLLTQATLDFNIRFRVPKTPGYLRYSEYPS